MLPVGLLPAGEHVAASVRVDEDEQIGGRSRVMRLEEGPGGLATSSLPRRAVRRRAHERPGARLPLLTAGRGVATSGRSCQSGGGWLVGDR